MSRKAAKDAAQGHRLEEPLAHFRAKRSILKMMQMQQRARPLVAYRERASAAVGLLWSGHSRPST